VPTDGIYAQTSVKTSDAAVKATSGVVYWVLASAAATGGAWQLDDGDGDGTVLVSGIQSANTTNYMAFDPPVLFKTAIFADIPGTNVTLTVGYN